MKHLEAFENEHLLIDKYTKDKAYTVWAMGLYLNTSDLQQLADDYLTDANDDHKIDFLYFDEDEKTLLVVQGFHSDAVKQSAKANKAADLNAALAWLFTGEIERFNDFMRPKVEEIRQALADNKLQFIELIFAHNCGESKEVDLELKTAANFLNEHFIVNQLGDTVNLVTEPERRDTFPAIALAASYLKLAKQCADDEVIVIMPCDPYTEPGYFETIGKMVECVKNNVADLVLMGIAPTYASEKYGYVVPVQEGSKVQGVQKVQRFTEKPTVQVAEELLKEGAFWNGGVFAFRLGYIMNIVKKYMTSDSFEDTRARYSEFPKISFDYEVAEKADSVAVVPFNGEWKDLGTWNTLTDELHKPVIGNAVMGAHCENTHVINELQNPIFVDGLKDVVVAACPDGILVCSKEHSEEIKKSVENLTPRPMYEERRWGTYRVLDDSYYADGRHSLTKSITLKEGKNISYQIHHHRSETWTFVQGEGIFVLDGQEQMVKAGDTVVIPVEHWHAIKALTELTFIEVQSGNPLIEEDIERTEWKWSE